MARRLPARLLKHTATPRVSRDGDAGTWAEGEPGAGPAPVDGTPFPCILFIPLGGSDQAQEQTWRPSRSIKRPTMLWNMEAAADGEQPADGMELLVDVGQDVQLARMLGVQVSRWLVDGSAQPYGPPGANFGAQVVLRRVDGP